MFTFEWFEVHCTIVELCNLFAALPSWYQERFLEYLQDEYAAMDDEFSEIIDKVMQCFYQFLHAREQLNSVSTLQSSNACQELCQELEGSLSQVAEKYDAKHLMSLRLVLESMVQYTKDELNDI